ncbi:MAG: terminase small subunit [Burkholderiales bacterium]|nr:terminase small subunit [Burkholderiales bacterium]
MAGKTKAAAKPAAKTARKAPVRKPGELPPRRALFVKHYLVSLNASEAARQAGYSAKTAGVIGHQLLTFPEIQLAVSQAMKERGERVQMEADEVLRRLALVATADSRELIEYRRVCCRYCHGIDHRYQWTPAEKERAEEKWERACDDARRQDLPQPQRPDFAGGVGYHIKNPPHPDCPECFGEGIERPFVHDTRKLSEKGAALYAGVKVTQQGIEVKQHSQFEALLQIGRHHGLFKDRVEGEMNHTHDATEELRQFLLGGGSDPLPVHQPEEKK